MRCYYDVLGIPLNSDSETIKKSYYKLSLKFHPDKNPGKENEVTPIYQEIQEANRVLSDAHEKAWYDRNRERILHGGFGQSNGEEEIKLDVFEYFTASCFSGFSDDENGFYSVYRSVFDKIKDEELISVTDTALIKLTTFGSSSSDYETIVGQFYSFWEAFCSQKSYVWEEKYDTRDLDRRLRRLVDADNKKLREAARKKRNQEVRALVAFVKKRDPRVQEHRNFLLKQSEANRQRSLKIAAEFIARDREQLESDLREYRELNQIETEEIEAKLRDLEMQWGEDFLSDTYSECENEVENTNLFCPACKKDFRSKASFNNHLPSKKHKKNLEMLRIELLEEDPDMTQNKLNELLDFEIELSSEDNLSTHSEIADEDLESENLPVIIEQSSKKQKKSSKGQEVIEMEKTKISNQDHLKSEADVVICKICQEVFDSRNKLFSHIKELGHAAPLINPKKNAQKKSKNKKK